MQSLAPGPTRSTSTDTWGAVRLLVWAGAMVGVAALFVASVPDRHAVLVAQAAAASGSVPDALLLGGAFPWVALGLEITFVAGFALLALVLGLARKGLLFGFTLLTYAVWVTPTLDALPVAGWQRVGVDVVQGTGIVLATQFFLLFPDARYRPRWSWVSGPVWVALTVPWVVDPSWRHSLRDPFVASPVAFALLLLGGWTVGLVAQRARYRREDTVGPRTPTRLPLAAIALACAGYGVVYAPRLALEGGTARAVYDLVAVPVFWVLALPMIAAFLVAVLRDQLFDVPLALRRTLVYAALTNILTALYVATTVVLRLVLDPVAGESQLSVAASTLVAVAAFTPVRRRLQAFVDRRFNRTQYDAARVVQAFSANVRDQVRLDQLREDLLQAVHQTVQPTTATVWLRRAPR